MRAINLGETNNDYILHNIRSFDCISRWAYARRDNQSNRGRGGREKEEEVKMSYYDYEYEFNSEPNYPEVEEIIDEASKGFTGFLHKTFVDEYKSIKVAKETNEIKERLLREQEQYLANKRKELNERETELAKTEEEHYGKLKSKWFTELGLAFDIGDTVYFYSDVTKDITCPTCNGARKLKVKVEGADNSILECKIDCPTCHGYGHIAGKKEYAIIEAKVQEINAHIFKRQDGVVGVEVRGSWYFDLITYVWVRDKRGDSTKIEGHNLYKTKEDCEKAIEVLKAGEQK